MTHARLLALLALAVSFLPACGHKGPPIAPLRRTPPALIDFRLAQRGDALEVSCFAPRASIDGVAFEHVDVEIFWGEGQIELEKEGQRRSVRAQPGARVLETLPLPAPGTLVRAAARAGVGGNKGSRTLILALEAQAPLTPPHGLTGRLRDKGVTLNWQGPRPEAIEPPDLGPAGGARMPFRDPFAREDEDPEAGTPETPAPEPETVGEAGAPGGEDRPAPTEEAAGGETEETAEAEEEDALPRTHGFRVYRRVASGAYRAPLHQEPQERRIRTDKRAPVGATACYVVRAVGSVEPLIESAPSNEACVAVRDISPPPPPTGLAVVPRDAGLEVVWSPSPAPDLGGYRIYRATGAGDAGEGEMVAEVTAAETAWRDTSPEPGVLYRYSIRALDRAGNEGPVSGEAEGAGPVSVERYFRVRADGAVAWARQEGEALRLLDGDPWSGPRERKETVPLAEASLLAPAAASKIVAVGRNYADHAAERGKAVPKEPLLFFKPPSAVIGPGEAIHHPSWVGRVDHEAELAAVIGRQASRLPGPEAALDHVFGATCVNDVTARELQERDVQFTRAKGFDTFCPVGPCIATGLDLGRRRVVGRVNGEVRQDGSTEQLVFSVAYLVWYVSRVMTLLPGDIISTGTPSGVGPIRPGDVTEIEVEGVGTLGNPVVEG